MSDETTEDEQATNSPDADAEQIVDDLLDQKTGADDKPTNSITQWVHRINDDPRFDHDKFDRAEAEQTNSIMELARHLSPMIQRSTEVDRLIRNSAEIAQKMALEAFDSAQRAREKFEPIWGANDLMERAGFTSKGIGRLTAGKAYSAEIGKRARQLWSEAGGEEELAEAADELADYIAEHFATPEGRCWRVFRLARNLGAHEEPEGIFYDYADSALESSGADDVPDEYRDKLARYLFEAVQRLEHRIQNSIDKLPDDYEGPITWSEDGMLWLDAVAIDWLEAEGWDGWPSAPDDARGVARERWSRRKSGGIEGHELLELWAPGDDIPTFLQPIELVCEHLWQTEVRPEMEAPTLSESLRVVRQAGDCYAKAPKPGGSISWALDGPGNIVQVDDDQYTDAPGIVRYVPRSVPVMPKGRRPNQQILDAGLYDDDEEIPLAVRTVGDVNAVLGTIEAKLALCMLITGERGMVADELRNLTKHLNPSKSRIQGRDDKRTAKALRRVRRLGVVLPDDTDIQLFSVQAPATDVRKDMEVSWGYTPHFRKLLDQLGEMPAPVGSLNGEFLLNYSAVMAFTGNEGVPLRHYVTAAAMWNDANDPATGKFSIDQLPRFDRESWAAKTNTLSQSAVDYLTEGSKSGSRADASRARRRALETLEDLEERGLIRLEGDRDDFRVVPTDDYLEAYDKWRAAGPRPKGDD